MYIMYLYFCISISIYVSIYLYIYYIYILHKHIYILYKLVSAKCIACVCYFMIADYNDIDK